MLDLQDILAGREVAGTWKLDDRDITAIVCHSALTARQVKGCVQARWWSSQRYPWYTELRNRCPGRGSVPGKWTAVVSAIGQAL